MKRAADWALAVREVSPRIAIARARQVLLVGDEKQLPPTNFFRKVESDSSITDEDEASGAGVGKDLESILGLGMVRMPHRFSLRWHYRSAHESLISFSNEKFYDNLLRVFPSAYTGRQDIGVQWRYVGGRYQRGAGRINPDEVRAVVDEVVAQGPAPPCNYTAFSIDRSCRDAGVD
jgi:superfamily I DNA and/or RNA helicase